MFCSTCGKPVDENLNFCKQCGARIGDEDIPVQSTSAGLISMAATGLMGMFGLFGFVFLALKLLEKNLGPGFVFMLLVLYVAAFLGVGFLSFKQTANQSPALRRKKKTNDNPTPKKLSAETFAQLNPPFQTPVSSVTENTTRTLDEMLVERK